MLCIIQIIWFISGPWRKLVISMTRQKIFEIRDDVFLYAAEGNIRFDAKPYTQLRWHLNRMIRLCHKMSLTTLLITLLFGDRLSNHGTIPTLVDLPPQTAKYLELKYFRAIGFMTFSMIARSPLGFLFFVLTALTAPVWVFLINPSLFKFAKTGARFIEDEIVAAEMIDGGLPSG